MLYLPTLVQKIEISLKDVDFPIGVSGLPSIPVTDFSSHLQDIYNVSFNWFIQNSLRLHEAHGILINTCQELELEQVNSVKEGKVLSTAEMRPSIYAIGPLISSYLSESDEERCLKWLDRHPASSVLFVSFGSHDTLLDNQIENFLLD